ncbi:MULTISPECIES: glycosyltransferase [Streptomyces]|uniref:Glycosyltransferase family 1 protein n=1 Tax=Streptomyces griseocarneus TaxID=51201 RepID=A0ABX7RLW8_9ACTN|nr:MULTISPECIES: glycosyltransferase [Streptomyces]QSY49260.1 glycosyltransferase family 1 protein [Streptomyces griseocarneus]
MSRFLFVVPPFVGHINPAAAVAAELTRRGHRVAWAGLPGLVEELAGPDADIHPCEVPRDLRRPPELRGAAALRYLWQDFLAPLAMAMAPGVERAAAAFRPDVIVADQQALSGALTAERLGIPYATSATTSAEFSGALAGMPKVDEWIHGLLAGLRAELGDPARTHDPRFSPDLVLAFTTTALTGESAAPPQTRFVGPALARRPDTTPFPWEWLDPARHTVLVSLGTANTDLGGRFLTECAAAVRERSPHLQAVIADLGGVLEGTSDDTVLAVRRMPQLALLRRASAVVCHAGHNTVAESLLHGVPLVVAPIRDDQPVIAAQLTTAGAGIRVRFGRGDRHAIGAALDAVLTAPEYRAAARRVQESFRAAGGAAAAATHLEEVATPIEENEEVAPTGQGEPGRS